ncbi:flagellin [Methylocystis iwaonis]|uniref:flagellin N-terminal helical domain-containing protein n=1 Tax=Methylocystis iwaonis TaxID=2885079 RepID=UPI002E7BD7D8|nr:flagellin [Methylocystis iwaonis]
MSSINTNPSAITALQSLRNTQNSLSVAQKQISTGLKISSASDNASTWSIAETMKSDQGVMSTLSDALNFAGSTLNVAANAVKGAISVMNSIKEAVYQAQTPGADLNKIGTNLKQLGESLSSYVSSATMNGINILDGSTTTTVAGGAALGVNFTASYTNHAGTAASSVGFISLATTDLTNTGGTGILQSATAVGSTATTNFTSLSAADVAAGTVADTLSNADLVIANLTTYAAQIGAVQSRVASQATFVQSLNDALTQGVSSLVDADMNQVSTRLQALQTQQQLGVQSLSIANQNSQLILKLFQ